MPDWFIKLKTKLVLLLKCGAARIIKSPLCNNREQKLVFRKLSCI